MAKFNVSLDLENIGPHMGDNEIHFSQEISSNKLVIYAMNGEGKTFISRAFRLASQEDQSGKADRLLSLNYDAGHMKFYIEGKGSLEVRLVRGENAEVQNGSGLTFHTFNSDYVNENIRFNGYNPDGNVTGYILGKAQIDLTEDRKEAEKRGGIASELKNLIETRVAEKKVETHNAGVEYNTSEMSLFTIDNVRANKEDECNFSSSEILAQLDVLKNVPENLLDISIPEIEVNLKTYGEIKSILNELYPNSEWDQDFVKYYKAHTTFISEGLKITHDNRCPFCRQPFSTDALEMINSYREYSKDREAETIREIQCLHKRVTEDVYLIKGFVDDVNKAKVELNEVKNYFPSLKEAELENFVIDDSAFDSFNEILNALKKKEDNLSEKIPLSENVVDACLRIIDEIVRIQKVNEGIIINANKTKNDSRKERLHLRRNLCLANFSELQSELRPKVDELKAAEQSLERIKAEIKTKEDQVRISKKEKVYNTLTELLHRFFDDKYTVNKETFNLEFNGSSIKNKATDILSDGEKSIVAFCLFLADVHRYIEREDDYDQMFFVIDDPISSMDFQHVYIMSQILRNMGNLFNINGHERIWIFTHNLEFYSILFRNNIVKDNSTYEMKAGKISKADSRLLLPYANHLRDIVKIARGELEPDYRTPNSIRHVIETVCKFEYPEERLDKYIENVPMLSSDALIYTLCQDMSHGNLREQPPYSSDHLKKACLILYEFIQKNYPGQIENI